MNEQTHVNFWVPKDLMVQIKTHSARTGKSIKQIGIEAFERYLNVPIRPFKPKTLVIVDKKLRANNPLAVQSYVYSEMRGDEYKDFQWVFEDDPSINHAISHYQGYQIEEFYAPNIRG